MSKTPQCGHIFNPGTVINYIIIIAANLIIDELFYGIVVTDINLVKVEGIVDVSPHVVMVLYMVLETLEQEVNW